MPGGPCGRLVTYPGGMRVPSESRVEACKLLFAVPGVVQLGLALQVQYNTLPEGYSRNIAHSYSRVVSWGGSACGNRCGPIPLDLQCIFQVISGN